MKRNLLIILPVLLCFFASFLSAHTIQNPANKIDISLGLMQTRATGFQAQGLFNVNEGFYIGIRFDGGAEFSHYSAVSRTLEAAHQTDYSAVSLLLGVQFGNFNERFNVFFNIMPGFAFAARKTGIGDNPGYVGPNVSSVYANEELSFFAPAAEIGFNCQLTQQLILSLGWQARLVSISDAYWDHNMWFIKLSETDGLSLTIPCRLSWRF